MEAVKKILLDSFAILAFLNKEAGFEKVKETMKREQELQQAVLMNEINAGEAYYILYHRRSRVQAC